MPSIRKGSIHLFRFAGVDLFLHWSWFVVAMFEIERWKSSYNSIVWSVLEYLALFSMVLLHEYGHALACRSVGGTADQIVLWPLGGVAYVNPPQRPGATLWSIAAGPLVNVALFPLLFAAFSMGRTAGWAHTQPDAYRLLLAALWIDGSLLVFNLLPVYPLDGGQILRSLLWFPLGRARSLMVATVLGLVGIVGFIGLALMRQSLWIAAISVFMLLNCWSGLKHAQALLKISKLPRRPGFACPSCRAAPPLGVYWQCGACGHPFDTFESGAVCPQCGKQFATTACMDCREQHPMSEWVVGSYAWRGANGGSTDR